MTTTVTLQIVLDDRMAQSLGSCLCRNFLHDQPERFEIIAIDNCDHVTDNDFAALTAGAFRNGTLTWCATLSDLLLLRAFEQSCGHPTAVLWDLAAAMTPGHDAYVLLSTRQYPY